jgi:hypothetical protein
MVEKKERNAKVTKKEVMSKSLFRQISKGDFVTINDGLAERKGHAVSREYGNWVLVLERNEGTVLATPANVVAVSEPRKLKQLPKVGDRITYDDGRKSSGQVIEVGPHSMYVLFDNSMEPSLIDFDDAQWVNYITLE